MLVIAHHMKSLLEAMAEKGLKAMQAVAVEELVVAAEQVLAVVDMVEEWFMVKDLKMHRQILDQVVEDLIQMKTQAQVQLELF